MLRTLRKRRFGMLFSVAGVMVSLNVVPVRAADLELPTDAKILEALKAKRLTRCPQTSTRPRCGGARLQHPPPKGRLSMSKSFSALLRGHRGLSFKARAEMMLGCEPIIDGANAHTAERCQPPSQVAAETGPARHVAGAADHGWDPAVAARSAGTPPALMAVISVSRGGRAMNRSASHENP
jgi:hypothetical protein